MSVTIYTPLAAPLLDADSQQVRIPRLTYSGVFMSERKVTATITSTTTLALASGCYITFRNETFRLYDTPSAKKVAMSGTAQNAFEYTLVFYSSQHELATTDFIDIVSDDSHTYFNGGPIVSFTGTIDMLAERIQANLDRIYTGENAWTVTVDPSVGVLDSADISLTDSTVWDALMLVSTTPAWALKFRVIGRVITIGISGVAQDDVTFQYGKGLGLYEITRTNVDSSKIITRLRAYGAATNIPSDYKRSGAGYVAPTYQYIKELAIPAYCYVAGATVNAVGKGNWSVGTQYAIGDLVRYTTTGSRYYCKAVPAVGIVPTNTTYWTLWNEGYIEDSAAIAEFGVREGIFRDETIFPTLKGMLGTGGVELDSILAVEPITDEAQTSFRVWIRDIGFDINDYPNTEKPTLSITRGALTGCDFEITNVVAGVVVFPSTIGTSAYVLTLTRNSEDSAILPAIDNNIYQAQETVSGTVYLLPNSTDELDKAKYVLTGISMPNVYVRAAEEKLLVVAQAYLDKYSVQQVTYAVGIDEIAAATNTVTWVSGGLIEGDLMPVLDVDMGVYGATVSDAKLVIVQTLTITVGDGMVNKYEVVLSDEPVAGTLDAIKSQIKKTGKTVVLGDRESNASARKNAVSLNNLKDVIFDTDGYFDGTHIKPNSIETLYLSVGAKSWDFLLYADIKPNAIVSGHTPNYNNIYLSVGTVIHNEIRWGADTDAGHTWDIGTALTITNLVTGSNYYIYAKCSTTANTAEWVVSDNSITVSEVANYYHFFIGVLYPALAAGEASSPHERGDSITYGKTWINGRFITTGVIQSLGGKSFFDLDNGHFYIGDSSDSAQATKFLDMDVNGTFRMKNITIVSGSGSSVLGAFMGAYSAGTPYYEGDTVTYQNGTWRCKTTSTGNTPAVGTYWEVYAAKGTDGTSVRITGNIATYTDLPELFDVGVTYSLTDTVIYSDAFYTCIHVSTPAGTLPTNGTYWAHVMDMVAGDGWIAQDTGNLWIWNGATWSDVGQIKGDIGVGISSVVLMYLVSTSATGITVSGNTWYGTPQTMTPTNKYHWSYQIITYTDASSVDTTPAVIGVYGDQGITGMTGLNSATVTLYHRTAGTPNDPPRGDTTYTFATGVLSGTITPWTQTIPADDGTPCYVTMATAVSNTATDVVATGEWSAKAKFVANGAKTAICSLYQRKATAPTIGFTSSLTYTFSTKTLSADPGSWFRAIPSGTDPLYIIQATAFSETDTDTIGYLEWSGVVKLVQDGAAGLDGADGADGSAGADGKTVDLTATELAAVFDTAGNLTSPSSITFTATAHNISTPYYQFFDNDSSLGLPVTGSTKAYSVTGKTYADMPRKIEVQVREDSATGTIVARDQIAITGLMAGSNGISVIDSNQAHTVPASTVGVVSSYAGSGTTIQVYEGSMLLKYSTTLAAGQFTIGTPTISPSASITVGYTTGGGTTTATVAAHSAMSNTEDVVTITYPLTIRRADGTDVTMVTTQTITKSKIGATGPIGNYYERRYKANGSPTVAPTNPNTSLTGWEVTIPVLTISEYCWVTTGLKNGVTNDLIGEWSAPSRISGAVGNVGPSSTYNGEWSATTQYIGTETVVQSVWYVDRYYITRSDAGIIPIGAAPTETAYWNPYGATFESVATRMLLAQGANVAGFIFINERLISQTGTLYGVASIDYENVDFIPNIILDGVAGYGRFGLLEIVGANAESKSLKITDDPIDLKAVATSATTYTIPYVEIDSDGILLNTATPSWEGESSIVTVEGDCALPTTYWVNGAFESSASNGSVIVTMTLEVWNNGVLIDTNSVDISSFAGTPWSAGVGISATGVALSKGTVQLKIIATLGSYSPAEYFWFRPVLSSLNTGYSANIVISTYLRRAVLGSDGIYMFANQNRYLYFRGANDANDVFEVRLGNVILKQTSTTISMTGLPTASNGLASGSLWRNGTVINIVA